MSPMGIFYSVPESSFSVSHGLVDWTLYNSYNIQYVHKSLAAFENESVLNRNISAILFSFHSLLIILLVHPIQEWPDKSAAQ